jgi:hypothetical protein
MKAMVKHLTKEELEAGLDDIRQSPDEEGTLELIVRRPRTLGREVLTHGELDTTEGLVGDNWKTRGSTMTSDRSSHPDMQINIINSRAISLIATDKTRWPLAGDQLYVDLDLSDSNLPAGTRLQAGTSVLEVTDVPHTGCKKFVERFGLDAMKFVNSVEGRAMNLRGINVRVVESGVVGTGDVIKKI